MFPSQGRDGKTVVVKHWGLYLYGPDGKASYATFSPDGSQLARTDDEGLKVAGVPNLAAGTDTCTLTAPAHVISATGRTPSFGGAER